MAMFEFDNRANHSMREAHDTVWHNGSEDLRHPAHPMPPHIRHQMIHIGFENKYLTVFQDVFGDEDTAAAAIDILCGAPPEIQILALQILHMIEKGGGLNADEHESN